jgi:rhodanese-related sulfurtransferase
MPTATRSSSMSRTRVLTAFLGRTTPALAPSSSRPHRTWLTSRVSLRSARRQHPPHHLRTVSTPPAHRVHTTCAPCRQPTGAPAAADPKIADRAKDKLIVVTCALGGQAKLGAKVLVEYGFTNVKVVEGGCVAWKGAGL